MGTQKNVGFAETTFQKSILRELMGYNMGGFDFKLIKGKEAEKFIKKFKKLGSINYDGKKIPSKKFEQIWNGEETSFSLTFVQEKDKREVWGCVDW